LGKAIKLTVQEQNVQDQIAQTMKSKKKWRMIFSPHLQFCIEADMNFSMSSSAKYYRTQTESQ